MDRKIVRKNSEDEDEICSTNEIQRLPINAIKERYNDLQRSFKKIQTENQII